MAESTQWTVTVQEASQKPVPADRISWQPVRPGGFKVGKWPLWVMAGLFIIGVGVAIVVWRSGAQPNSREWELAKIGMQIGVVAVAGALLTFVTDNYKRRLERLRFREEFLKEIQKRVTTSYNKSKGARRMARAGLTVTDKPGPGQVEIKAYDKCIADVNDAQLDLEAVKRDLQTSRTIFPEDAATEKMVKSMESYLNKIVSEYEKIRSGAPPTTLLLDRASRFAEFVRSGEHKEFDDYADTHGDVRRAINEQLLGLTR